MILDVDVELSHISKSIVTIIAMKKIILLVVALMVMMLLEVLCWVIYIHGRSMGGMVGCNVRVQVVHVVVG